MPARFDVFLSHATTDKLLVEELARRLTRENLRPWLDKWNLIPGMPWQPEIEAVLVDCVACAVFIGPAGIGPWQHEEMRQAIRRRVEDREQVFRVIPVLLPGLERPERSKLPDSLTATTWVEFRDTLDDPEAFHRLICGIRGIEPKKGPGSAAFEGQNPYRGLELFDVKHAPLFFGREALTEWLLDALKRKSSGVENRFLAIVGASGSGKSSLARAGLLAALKDGKLAGSAAWPQAICRPGAEPFLNLANALTGLASASVSALVFDRLQDRKYGERALHVAAALVLGEPPRAERLVVLVDQFEEVFTLCADQSERRQFLATLLHAATVAGGRTIVVLAMRADFYPRCATHADLAAALSDHQVLVGPMADDELRAAIKHPARLAGLEPEPGLVELLVNDLRGRVGALPLLQFALQEVWRRREDYRLTIRTYRDIGGLEGALERKADKVYDQFTPDQQEICRRVFLSLIQPGEGSEDTRRRALHSELVPPDPTQAAAVQAIIDRLTAPETRLLTTERRPTDSSDGTLEVAHEALIRGWPRLRTWIESDRAGLRTRNRLNDAATDWADAPEEAKESMLYSGARLAVATEWAAAHRNDLGALAARFLSASQEQERLKKADEAERNRRLAEAERQRAEEAVARQQAERERAEKAELYAAEAEARQTAERQRAEEAEARQEAERQRAQEAEARQATEHQRVQEAEAATKHQIKLSQWLLWTAVVAASLALAAVWQTWRANSANKLATTKAKQAKSRQLAALSTAERSKHLDRSLLLAVEALRTDNNFEARDNLYRALQERPGLRILLHNDEDDVLSIAFSPDGKKIAAGGQNNVMLWDVANSTLLSEKPLAVKGGSVSSVAFSPDGNTLATGYIYDGGGSGGVELWDVAGLTPLGEKPLAIKEGGVFSVAFSHDGKKIAAGCGYGGVALWDVANRTPQGEKRLAVQGDNVSSVAFSPDGKILAAGYGYGGGGVALWDAVGLTPLGEKPLAVEEGDVSSLAFSPDGNTLAAGYRGGRGGGVALWDVANRTPQGEKPLVVQGGDVSSVAFSPDGKKIAAGYHGDDGSSVVLWDVAGRTRLGKEPLTMQADLVSSLAFSPDGNTLAAGYRGGDGGGGGVALWDVPGRTRLRLREELFALNQGEISSLAFSPDGNTLAAGCRNSVALWNVAGRNRLVDKPLAVKEGWVSSIAFSPDGKTLAAGYGYGDGGGGGVALWDVVGLTPLGEKPLAVKESWVSSVVFSPDGKTLATGYRGGSGGVALWDVAGRNRLVDKPLAVKEGWVSSIAFSPDGKTLAAGYRGGSGGGGVALWDVAGRNQLVDKPLAVKEGWVSNIAFSPDGKTLAAGYRGGGVALWDVVGRTRPGKELLAIQKDRISSLAFSPDGKTLAAGYGFGVGVINSVGSVVLWDVADGTRLVAKLLDVKDDAVLSVAFSPDSRTIAVGCSRVLLCDVDLESWKRIAGRVANRNFTRDEWRQYFPDEDYHPTFPDLPVPPEVPSQQGARRQ